MAQASNEMSDLPVSEDGSKRRRYCAAALAIILLLILRYDFTFHLGSYKVREGDTLWSILDDRVFHSAAITRLSILYLEKNNPGMDWDHIEANSNKEGGYTVRVKKNALYIYASDDTAVVEQAVLLPANALFNHFLQVLAYDLCLLAVFFYFYAMLTDADFRPKWSLFGTILLTPLFWGVMLPVFLLVFWLLWARMMQTETGQSVRNSVQTIPLDARQYEPISVPKSP